MSVSDMGIRSAVIASYDFPKLFYSGAFAGSRRIGGSAVFQLKELGCLLRYAHEFSHTGRKRKKSMDIDKMVEKWKAVVAGLATAHDKDEADRFEASIDECLSPILTAPIKEIRVFATHLLIALKADPQIPFLVWRGYEAWVELVIDTAPDEEIKTLKTDLAKQIVDMVEEDAKSQLPEAMIRALQWRSPEKLEEVKEVVEKEKKAGRSVRLRGRESCLFLEAGGTESEPKVCVQI